MDLELIKAAAQFVHYKVQDNLVVSSLGSIGNDAPRDVFPYKLPLSSPLTYCFFRRYLTSFGLEAVAALLEDTTQYRRILNQGSRVCNESR